MSQISRDALQRLYKLTNYIGMAMIGSVFTYAALVLAINMGYIPLKLTQTIDVSIFTTLKYILLFISILSYFIIKFLQKIFSQSVRTLLVASIIAFALSEAVSIYGLVLFFLTRNPNDFFLFMAISMLYFYIFYPRYADWERLLTQELQAPSSR